MGIMMKILATAVVASCGAAPSHAGPTNAERILAETTTANGVTYVERYADFPVKDYPRQQAAPTRLPVMQTLIPTVAAGDILMVQGALQVTNDLTYSVELGCKLIYSGNSGEVEGSHLIMKEHGFNATPQLAQLTAGGQVYQPVWRRAANPTGGDLINGTFMGEHHAIFPFNATFVVPSAATNRYVTLVCYAGGSSETGADDRLLIDKNGSMSVVRLY
jgi:hypothetical protein